MTFWRRIWQRQEQPLAACTALDVGTEFAKALVFEIDGSAAAGGAGARGHGTVRGVGRRRQGLSHMQSGTVADIAAVVDNCAVALQEAEEMAGFRPTQVVIGIAGELVKGFTTVHTQERKKPSQPITENVGGSLDVGNANYHPFTISRSGDFSVTLNSLDPTSSATVGVGLGTFTNSVCTLQFTNNGFRVGAVYTNSLSGAGAYCVAIYDIGNLTQTV